MSYAPQVRRFKAEAKRPWKVTCALLPWTCVLGWSPPPLSIFTNIISERGPWGLSVTHPPGRWHSSFKWDKAFASGISISKVKHVRYTAAVWWRWVWTPPSSLVNKEVWPNSDNKGLFVLGYAVFFNGWIQFGLFMTTGFVCGLKTIIHFLSPLCSFDSQLEPIADYFGKEVE